MKKLCFTLFLPLLLSLSACGSPEPGYEAVNAFYAELLTRSGLEAAVMADRVRGVSGPALSV